MSEIQTPGGFTPQRAIAFAAGADAVPVDASNPLPTSDRAYVGAVAVVVGTDQAPRRAIAVTCATGGNVVLKLADDSLFTAAVTSGLSILPFAVKTVVAAGTTAAATYANLI